MSFPLYFLDPLLEVFCDVGDLVLDVLTSEWLGFLVCSECFIVLIVFVILIVQSTRSAMVIY